MDTAPRVFTIAQVADMLQVSQKTVRRLVWAHELTHHRIGTAIRIPEQAVDDYLHRVQTPAAG